MEFDRAFQLLFANEGGYTDDPRDPGNWTGGSPGNGVLKGTKYGISAKAYPSEDIKGLTIERAKEIYKRDYWGPAGCEVVPDLIRFELFDLAVNTSAPGNCKQAIKILQRAVSENDDGVIGPRTLAALQQLDPSTLLRRLQAQRIRFYTSIPPQRRDTWLAGWMNRVADNMMRV